MKIKYLTVTTILNFIVKIHSKLSPKDIRDVIESQEIDASKRQILRSSIINPIYGYLFEAVGALNNIRFYGPLLKSGKSKDNKRDFAKDSSDDDIVKLSILLFPSPTGILNHIRNIDTNFGYKIKKIIEEGSGIHLMSKLFIKVLTNQPVDGEALEINPNIYTDEIDQVVDIVHSKNKSQVFNNVDSQLIKLMIFHSFMINILDDKQHLKEYLSYILDNSTEYLKELPCLNIDLCNQVLEFGKRYLIFPYSPINKPPSNSAIPIYDRQNGHFIQNQTFSDCADVLLLNLCNCLLYDPVMLCYSTNKLPEKSDISTFYQKYNILYTITDEIRNEWSKVIQGLPNFTSEDDDGKYKLNEILYIKKEVRNEVEPGIINMMNILIKIFKIDHIKFWQGFKGKDNIHEKLLELFNLISNGCKISIKNYKFEEEKIGQRLDITGSFDIKFEGIKDLDITITIEHSVTHAEMKISNYEMRVSEIQEVQEVQTDSLLSALYLVFFMRNKNVENSNIFKTIYFSEPLQTNEQKKKILNKILESIAQDTKSTNNILEGITVSILETVNLNDNGTKELFLPYLVYLDGLSDSEIIKCWKRSLTVGVESDIDRVWLPKMKKRKLSELGMEMISIPLKRKLNAFETLSALDSLESLELMGLQPEEIVDVSNGLNRLYQLKNITLSQNKFSKIFSCDQIKCLSDALSQLTSLRSFDLSFNLQKYVGTGFFRILLGDLTQLTGLKIANVCFLQSEIECLSDVLLKLTNLTSLHISDSQRNDQGFDIFAKTISEMRQLTKLSLSNFKLNENKKFSFPEAPEHASNLKSLSFSSCDLTFEGLGNLATELEKLTNLTELSFSNIKSKENWIDYLSKSISQLINLTTLNITEDKFISFDKLACLLQDLEKMNSLTALNISSLKMNLQGVECFTKALGNLTQLTDLTLSSFFFGDQELKHITTAIGNLKNLINLDISRNSYSLDELFSLLKTLQESINLRSLTMKISLNKSSKINIQQISRQLCKLNQLTKLEISAEHSMPPVNRRYILEYIRRLKNLTTLIIPDHFFETKDLQYVLGVLKSLKELKSISIRGNNFNHEILNKIELELPTLMIFQK